MKMRNLTAVVLEDGAISLAIEGMGVEHLAHVSLALMRFIQKSLSEARMLDMEEVMRAIADSLQALIELNEAGTNVEGELQ